MTEEEVNFDLTAKKKKKKKKTLLIWMGQIKLRMKKLPPLRRRLQRKKRKKLNLKRKMKT